MTWYDRVIIAAAVITAVGIIWKKVIQPLYRAITVVEQSYPVLIDIAEQFRPNGGHSLKDHLDDLSTKLELEAVERRRFEKYVHNRFHDLNSEIQKLGLRVHVVEEDRHHG